MTKFERYDRATDALEDAAMSLRIGLGQLRKLPERDAAAGVEAIIRTLEGYSAGMRVRLMGDVGYREHLSTYGDGGEGEVWL